MLRDKNHQVREFQNTCRHRGMILVEHPTKINGTIRCPYHIWCYGTDGRLVSTPHVGRPGHSTYQDINRSELGLYEIRSYVWRDVVWVNMNNKAPAFVDAMQNAIQQWAEFAQPLYHVGDDRKFKLDVNCNWKLAVEIYCESYHLP
tara:strand:+ start:1773 stop:2210 length:438 start_codon:yes stop_codon:yes gene_type:complete